MDLRQPDRTIIPKIERLPVARVDTAYLLGMTQALHLNGLMYLPQLNTGADGKVKIGQEVAEQEWFKNLMTTSPEVSASAARFDDDVISARQRIRQAWSEINGRELEIRKDNGSFYVEQCDSLLDFYLWHKRTNDDQNPEWFNGLSDDAKRHLVFWSIRVDLDKFPPHFSFLATPYTGINSFVIENQEMFSEMEKVFKLWRLHGIKQLAYKHDPVPAQSDLKQNVFEFPHTRYSHLFDVVAIATLLGNNSQLSPEELRILQIISLTHDFRTPAGGDTIKAIDPETFDEDKHYNEIFRTKEWKDFARKHKISKKEEGEIYNAVLGKGKLGKLLDVADKLAYVGRDVSMYLDGVIRVLSFKDESGEWQSSEDTLGFQAIQRLAQSDPLICSLWESVEVVDDKIVVSDTNRLANFLKLRALLFKEFYYNPYSRFSVDKFAQEVVRHLYQQGEVTRDQLLTENDSDLNARIEEFTGVRLFPILVKSQHSQLTKCATVEEAHDLAQKFNNESDKIAIIDDWNVATNSATETFFVKKDGVVLSFTDAFPEQAREVDGILEASRQFNVYVLDLNDLGVSDSKKAKVKEIFKIKR